MIKQSESEQIKKAFVNLRKFGHFVFNFNSNRPNRAGIKFHPDWTILSKKNVIYCEVKLGKDVLSEGQKEVINRLAHLMGLSGSRIYVTSIKTGKEAQKLAERILKGDL